MLQARQIDLAAAENSLIFRREILANECHQADGREVTRGQSEIARRPSERAFNLAVRGFNAIESDRSTYQKRHDLSCFLAGRAGQFCGLFSDVLANDRPEAL